MTVWDGIASAWSVLPFGLRARLLRAVNHKVTLGVLGLITDDAGRVMVLDHRFRPRWTWGLPGGFVSRGEALVPALIRELREETGLVIAVDPVPFDIEHLVGPSAVTVTYTARVVSGAVEPLALSAELRAGGFYAPGDIPAEIYPPHAALIRRWASSSSSVRQRT